MILKGMYEHFEINTTRFRTNIELNKLECKKKLFTLQLNF